MTFIVENVGSSALLQNIVGREGHAQLGIPHCGAFDRAAAQQANRLLTNLPNLYTIETVLGGFTGQTTIPTTIVVTGTNTKILVRRNNQPGWVLGPVGQPIYLGAGDRFQLTHPTVGIRSYIAIYGGFEPAPNFYTFSSASYDTLSHLGHPPIKKGDTFATKLLPTTPLQHYPYHVSTTPVSSTFRLLPGPHQNLLPTQTQRGKVWRVGTQSNRIGMTLVSSNPVTHNVSVPSEPVTRGTVQLTPDGTLIVFGPDAPTTGGYPVVGIVHSEDVDRFAQHPPGTPILFQTV